MNDLTVLNFIKRLVVTSVLFFATVQVMACPLISIDTDWTEVGQRVTIQGVDSRPEQPFTHINLQRRIEGGKWERIRLWDRPALSFDDRLIIPGNYQYRAREERRSTNGTITFRGDWCSSVNHLIVDSGLPAPGFINTFPNSSTCMWDLSTRFASGADEYIWIGVPPSPRSRIRFVSHNNGPSVIGGDIENLCVVARHGSRFSRGYCLESLPPLSSTNPSCAE